MWGTREREVRRLPKGLGLSNQRVKVLVAEKKNIVGRSGVGR